MTLTTWTATMMVETVVDVLSTNNTAQTANALTAMEVLSGTVCTQQQLVQQQFNQLKINAMQCRMDW
jgi:hypothetical protein